MNNKTQELPTHQDWQDKLTERERKEVSLARTYTRLYSHGTTGHIRLLLIAKLANLLDGTEPAP